jgi:hypothetical protein
MRRFLAGAGIALIAASTVTACRGDDDNGSTSQRPSRTDTTSDSVAPSSRPSGAVPTLRDVLDRQADAVIKVTYQRGTDTFTIAQDHQRKAIRSGNALSISDGTRSVDCTHPSCVELPPDVTSIASLGLTFYNVIAQSLPTAADATPPIETTRDVVAGQPAVCARGDAAMFLSELVATIGSVPPATVRVCVDEATGYLLQYRNESDPKDDLVATTVSRPSRSDFAVPAPAEPLE